MESHCIDRAKSLLTELVDLLKRSQRLVVRYKPVFKESVSRKGQLHIFGLLQTRISRGQIFTNGIILKNCGNTSGKIASQKYCQLCSL